MQATTTRPKIIATADGEGVVSHAGSRLLADVADRTTLTAQLSEVLAFPTSTGGQIGMGEARKFRRSGLTAATARMAPISASIFFPPTAHALLYGCGTPRS